MRHPPPLLNIKRKGSMTSTTSDRVTARANRARNRSITRLIATHEDEYKQILAQERRAEGLFPEPGVQRKKTTKALLAEREEQIRQIIELAQSRGIKIEDMPIPAEEIAAMINGSPETT